MEPNFTKDHLDRMELKPEDHAYYSQPDEIKLLLLERNYYKSALEKQTEKINNFSKCVDSILNKSNIPTYLRINYKLKLNKNITYY
jgi:hypothetical protein